jgi:DNA recombination protein RmuC
MSSAGSIIVGITIGVVAGAAVGALVMWLAARARHANATRAIEAEAAAARALLDERAAHAARLAAERDTLRQAVEARDRDAAAHAGEIARLAEELRGERQATADKLALLDDAQKALRDAFGALSADALHKNNESFLKLAATQLDGLRTQTVQDLEGRQKAIDALVRPIADSLRSMDTKLQDVEKERVGAYTALIEQVRSLVQSQDQLRNETAHLARALHSPASRGRWGEIQLRRVVELAGMLDHCDFVEQPTVSSEDDRLRPDLVVKLPGGKNIVVDSKAPLSAFLEAHDASDETVRDQRLAEHAAHVRGHMKRLGDKRYWTQFEPSPELVVMFLPGETFFSAALLKDPSLIEYGIAQGVIPASPTTLISLLRAVEAGWRQEKIAESAEQIRKIGLELYERLAKLAQTFGGVGKSLDRAVRAYNIAAGSLESRVLVSARRFKELGAGSSRAVPALEPLDTTARPLSVPEIDGPADDEPAVEERTLDLFAGRPAAAGPIEGSDETESMRER